MADKFSLIKQGEIRHGCRCILSFFLTVNKNRFQCDPRPFGGFLQQGYILGGKGALVGIVERKSRFFDSQRLSMKTKAGLIGA